jgi:histidinol-phosphate aminotransferase
MEKNNLVRKNILDLKPYIPGKPIEDVQRELGLEEVVKLASNETSIGPSPLAVDAIKREEKILIFIRKEQAGY